jgi:hypothetical protein
LTDEQSQTFAPIAIMPREPSPVIPPGPLYGARRSDP